MEKSKRNRRNLTLRDDLYKEIKVLAAINGKNANDLIEEGMERIIEEYKKKLEKEE